MDTRSREELFQQAPVLAAPLLAWFAEARRALPWRERYEPYAVWISEMMLQQTQVETVLPYYRRWMERFPSVEAVAEAPLADVLKLWEGLGYYSRARNLHRAAQVVMDQHGGTCPSTVEALLELPGIGRYTAGAIASIAFNQPVPLVDGNVVRVLSRVFAVRESYKRPEGQRLLWGLAEAALPHDRPREFNEGLMELGALICRPRAPNCLLCPWSAHCQARELGNPEAFPVREARKARPVRHGVLLLAQNGDALLVRQRPADGLWGGMWEFPWIERTAKEPSDAAVQRLMGELSLRGKVSPAEVGQVSHGLTHFQLELACFTARFKTAKAPPPESAAKWVSPAELKALALGRFNHKALALLKASAKQDG
ncbi:MAG TPA: A/G-specific adenine glycosylase [bacterium]